MDTQSAKFQIVNFQDMEILKLLPLAELKSHWVLLWDIYGKVHYCSGGSLGVSGYVPDYFKQVDDLVAIMPNGKSVTKEQLINKMELGKGLQFQYFISNKNNEKVSVVHTQETVSFNKGDLIYATISKLELGLIEEIQSLKESEEMFKLLAENSTDVVALMNLDFTCAYMSPSVKTIFGYDPEEVIGHPINNFMTPKAFQKVMETNQQRLVMETKNPGSSVPLYVDIEIIDKYGQKVWGEVISSPVFDEERKLKALLLSIRDITERKSTLTLIKKLSQSVEHSPSMIVITDTQGSIEYVNPKFSKVTQYAYQEAVGKRTSILKSGDMPDDVYKRLWETISAGHQWAGEFRNRKKNGELYWEWCVISPVLDDNGKIINYVAVKEDITQKKEMDRQIYQTILETERKERERFAKELHDGLGAHLSAINVYLNMLIGENLEEAERNEMLETIRSIVSEAKQSAREIANNIRPDTLTKKGLIAYFREYFANINKTKKLEVRYTALPASMELEMHVEENLFRIISELFNNSLKHALASYIEVSLIKRGNVLDFQYADNGKGFDLFAKLKERRDGMGLINIYKRAESINGKCEMYSEPGKGLQTKIQIYLNQ